MKRLIFLLGLLSLNPCLWGQISLIAHAANAATSANGTATTSAQNGTGANFIAACVTTYSASCTGATVSDSINGTWSTHGTNYSNSSGSTSNSCLWYKANASVNSSMTVSAVLTGGYAQVAAAWFSNVATSSPLDQEAGKGTTSTTTDQPGSITPGQANELLLSCTGRQSQFTGSATVSGSGFSVTDSIVGASPNGQATGMAYVVQTSATAANPTWNYSTLTSLSGGGLTNESFQQLSSASFKTQAGAFLVGP